MEIIKKNIHMDRVKCRCSMQVTLDEDINITESKPDVAVLIYDKATIQIEEVRPTEDHVGIRGRLLFSVLYETGEDGMKLVSLEGRIPFEQQLNLEGVRGGDRVIVKTEIEDLTIDVINSRKLSVRSMFHLKACVEELYDTEVPEELIFAETGTVLEYRKAPLEVCEIVAQKNDNFRIRQEVTLPQSYPNFYRMIWQEVHLEDMEFKPITDAILVQGEARIFVVYEGEGAGDTAYVFETTLPFSGNMECSGAYEGMVGDIGYETAHAELDIRPDLDGEERMLGLDMMLDVAIKLYDEVRLEMIADVYGVTKEVESREKEAELKQLLIKINGKTKVSDRILIKNPEERILQILNSKANIVVDRKELTEEGISVEGTIAVRAMYITGNDEMPYGSVQGFLPFSYVLEVPGIGMEDSFNLKADVSQLQVVLIGNEEMDVKVVMDLKATVFRNMQCKVIEELRLQEPDAEKMNDLPGMVVHVVMDGDNLWNIGKRYYVPVDRIREINELKTDELKAGDKLLLVKGM